MLLNILPATEDIVKEEKRFAVIVVSNDDSHVAWFRKSFDSWSHLVYYCTSFQEAQSIMDAVLPDILILYPDTPGSSCHDFLINLQKKFPQTIRMVFSSEQDKLSLLKLVSDGTAHRFFCLPWAENDVAKILENDLEVRTKIPVRQCLNFLKLGRGIPSLPEVVQEMEEILRNPDYQLDDVITVLEKDPAIAARLLKVVNSSLFSKRCNIETLHHAVNFLGISHARKIILFICATQHFQYPKRHHKLILKIIGYSWQCSRLAALIANEVFADQDLEKTAATAALLHDIGKLVLCSYLGATSPDFIARDYALGHETIKAEKAQFGISHLELGSTLLLLWNLPLAIIETISKHALPLSKLEGIPQIVAIADRCLQEIHSSGRITTDLDILKPHFPVDEWREMAKKVIEVL